MIQHRLEGLVAVGIDDRYLYPVAGEFLRGIRACETTAHDNDLYVFGGICHECS